MELRHYVTVLLKWWWLIVASVLVASVSSYLGTRAVPTSYISRATLMVGQALQDPNPNYSEFYTGQVLAQNYADLARREPVLQGVLDSLGLSWHWTALQGMVSTRAIPNSQLLEITVIDSDAERARILADQVATQLILQTPAASDPQKEAERQFTQTQIEDLKAKITKSQDEMRQLDDTIAKANSARQIQDARSRQTALQMQISTWQATYAQLLTTLQQGTPNFLSVVEPARPAYPTGPNTRNNVMLAAAIGLMLAVGAAFLLEYIDDTIKTPDDVRDVLGLATLGGIARIEGVDYPHKLVAALHPRSPIAEAYRVLRTNLQFSAVDRPMRTLMVTSPNPVEGKSVTAANLAAVMAQSGKRVILVDADMRRPVQHHVFEVGNGKGLTTLLLNGEIHTQDMLCPTPVENLLVLPCGPIPPNPSELLGSKRMGELIETLQQEADVVIFDSPPVLAVADATILATRLDGTLLVVDSGGTRRAMANRAKEALAAVGAYLPGVALNRLSSRTGGYYYYYYYYYSSDGDRRRKKYSRRNPLARWLPGGLFGRNGHSDNGHEEQDETEQEISSAQARQ